MSEEKIRIAIVEDCQPLLESLKLEVNRSGGMTCVGTFELSETLLKSMAKLQPDVVLMDLGLPRMDGVAATREIRKRWPRVKVLVFTNHDDRAQIIEALSAGAAGYLLKSEPRHKLAEAIRRLHNGRAALSETVSQELVMFFNLRPEMIQHLSPQEERILKEFDKGGSYKEISDRLGISINTLKQHAKRIRSKCAVGTMAAAAFVRQSVI